MRPNQNNILEHLPFPLATSKCCPHLHFIQKLFSIKCRAIERRAGSITEQAQHQAARSWSLYPLPFSPSKSLNDCLHDRARSKREPCLGFVSWSQGRRCWSEYPGWERAWLCSHFVSKCSHHFSVAFRMELQETLQRDGSHVDTRAPQTEVHHSFCYFLMPRLKQLCVLAGLINQCNGYTGLHPEEFYSLRELYIFFWTEDFGFHCGAKHLVFECLAHPLDALTSACFH